MTRNLGVLASWRENSKVWCGRVLVLSYALITIAAVIPYGSATETITIVSIDFDKIIHFAGFAYITLLALGAGRGLLFWKRLSLVLSVVLFGVAIEFAQYYIPYRTFNPVDIFANLCGVLLGILLWVLLIAHGAKGMEHRAEHMARKLGKRHD